MMLENNDAFFYNYEMEAGKSGYGSMKDFLDLGSMFKSAKISLNALL